MAAGETSMNAATLWARTAVQALVEAGLREICIAPGSRSTALALAFAAHPDVRVYRQLDERSAGFFALGMALALDRPVALLCTSGTATVNFMPAIVEARMAQAPLLALTADRPPELRHSGANQTIDQVELYGKQVLWSVDIALPEQEPPDVALRNLRATMARAMAVADGAPKGPVHLNFPFRKPFEPATSEPWAVEAAGQGSPQMASGVLAPQAEQLDRLAALIAEHDRGLIVCGPRCPGGVFAESVAALSQRSGYPIMADPLSGVRFGPWVAKATVSGGYDGMLAQGKAPWQERPQLVLRFGAVPTSRWLNEYLLASAPRHVLHVRSNGVWADDSHRTSLFLQADEALVCQGLLQRLPQRGATPWQEAIAAAEALYWRAIAGDAGDFFDGLVLHDVVSMLPDEALLFVGNSLPVRHLDQYGAPRAAPLHAFGNRGASGIDGNISSALGIAAALGRPVTLVVGDVTFYHDMNGLLAARDHDLQATIVLLNNDGGGIFRRLPVARFEPPFRELFLTPHGLDFSHAARLYGFDYVQVEERDAFRRHFTEAMASDGRRIVEVRSDGEADAARRLALQERVLERLGIGD